jgi:shikimate kinase
VIDTPNIILTGFMGSGKTTVGRTLARRLDWEFLDMDVEIERVAEMSVTEIFRRYGEVRFRSEESVLIDKLRRQRDCVIATGGGTVLNPDNLKRLDEIGVIVHLHVTLAEAVSRIKQKNTRPLLKKSWEELDEIWRSRQSVYWQAEVSIDTSGKTVETIAQEIITYLQERGA